MRDYRPLCWNLYSFFVASESGVKTTESSGSWQTNGSPRAAEQTACGVYWRFRTRPGRPHGSSGNAGIWMRRNSIIVICGKGYVCQKIKKKHKVKLNWNIKRGSRPLLKIQSCYYLSGEKLIHICYGFPFLRSLMSSNLAPLSVSTTHNPLLAFSCFPALRERPLLAFAVVAWFCDTHFISFLLLMNSNKNEPPHISLYFLTTAFGGSCGRWHVSWIISEKPVSSETTFGS